MFNAHSPILVDSLLRPGAILYLHSEVSYNSILITSEQRTADRLDESVSSTFRTPPGLEEDAVSVSEIDVVPAIDGLTAVNVLRYCFRNIQAQKIR